MTRLAKLIVVAGRGQSEPPDMKEGSNGQGWYLTKNDGTRVGKVCGSCLELKHYVEFGNHSKATDGKRNNCKECVNEYGRKYYEENKEHLLECKRERYQNDEEYRERERKYQREHFAEYPEKYFLRKVRRRARVKALPDDMTAGQGDAIADRFTCCPLTGSQDTEEEHFQAISWGQGEGHSVRNVWHLDGNLNRWKRARNPFEFFRSGEVIKHIEDVHDVPHAEVIRRIESMFAYFADMNDMTVEEFEAYTAYCYEHQKTDEEIERLNAAGETVDSRKEFERHSAAKYISI